MGLVDRIKSMKVVNAALIGLVLSGVYYLSFFDSGKQMKAQVAQVDRELSSLKQEIVDLEEAFIDAERLHQVAAELGASINKVLKYIPEKLTDSEVVKNLSTSARAVGAKIVGIRSKSQSTRQDNDFYDELPVVVELVGTYGQIMSFLSRLTQVERIYTVRDMVFSVQRQTDDAEVKFTTTVVGYKYKGNRKSGEGESK